MEGLDTFAPDVDLTADIEDVVTEQQIEPVVVEKQEEKPAVKEETKETRPEKMVSIDNLTAVNAKAREWRLKAEQVERESKERFEKLEQRLQLMANPPQPQPKFEEDPAGHLKFQTEQVASELQSLKKLSEETRQQQEAVEFERQITINTQSAEAVFIKDHPDYLAAVQHLTSIADRNLELMGMEDPGQRLAQIRKDALAMSLKAMQMGKNPADVAYTLAQNYGYKPAESKQVSQQASAKVAAITAGQQTAGMPDGGTKSNDLTLAEIEKMDDDEFNKLIDDPKAWSKLVKKMA